MIGCFANRIAGKAKEQFFASNFFGACYFFFKLPDKSAVYSACPECAACDEIVTAVRSICSEWHDFLYTNTILRMFYVRREAEFKSTAAGDDDGDSE